MVVGDHASLAFWEHALVASLTGCTPHLLHDLGGILLAHTLLVETRTLTTNHVEEYAVAHVIVLRQVLGKILSTERPCVAVVCHVGPLRRATVFGIEAHEVDTHVHRAVVLHQSGKLQHHSHAARAIVGSHHGLAPVGRVGVVVCPWATVIVGAHQQACCHLRFGAGYDVLALQYGAVPTFQVGVLCGHLAAKLLKLVDDPLCTLVVCLAVHRSRTKQTLLLTVGVGRVGVERRSHKGHCLVARCAVFLGALARAYGCCHDDGCTKIQKTFFHCC